MKPALALLLIILIITYLLFYFEYGKRSIWFSNTSSVNDPFRQREDFVSSELDTFGFAYPSLKNSVVYKPLFSFQNNDGNETEFALTRLIFQDSGIINGRELDNNLQNQGYTLVASPNEYYECSVTGNENTYTYHTICNGCNLKKKQRSRDRFDSVNVGGAQMFYVEDGPYKKAGVNYVINAVVVPNYDRSNLVNLTEDFIKTYNEITTAFSEKISKAKEDSTKLITDSAVNLENISLHNTEMLSDRLFDPVKVQRLQNLKKALNNIFNELARPNSWAQQKAMNNLVLPMITTGGGGISYPQFFETLFEVIKVRLDSNKILPKRIILSVFPRQKNLYSIKHSLGSEILRFYESREHKEVINKQRLSFLSRLIGILIAMFSFLILMKRNIIQLDSYSEAPIHIAIYKRSAFAM